MPTPTPTPVKGGKLPKKARVKAIIGYANEALNIPVSIHLALTSGECRLKLITRLKQRGPFPVAILPCATKAQAARICKAYNMTPEWRVYLVASIFAEANYIAFKNADLKQQITQTAVETEAFAVRVLDLLGLGGEATR